MGAYDDMPLRICKNKECSRFNTIVATPDKRCFMCNSRLRKYVWDEDNADQPVLIDGSTSPHQQPHVAKGQYGLVVLNKPNSSDNTGKNRHRDPDEPIAFDSDCDVEGTCPVAAKEAKPIIKVPWSLWQSWVFLAHSFPTEWIAYLRGVEADGGWDISAEGMYFPNQLVTPMHVKVPNRSNTEVLEGTIASVHSHVDMNAYFSSEDKDHWNFPVEMVVNRSGKVAAAVRIKLECGRFTRVETGVRLIGTSADVGLASELKAKMTVDRPRARTEEEATAAAKEEFRKKTYAYRNGGYTVIDKRHSSGSPRSDRLLEDDEERYYRRLEEMWERESRASRLPD